MVVAVIAAIVAGCLFAVGAVLQQSAAREAPRSESLSWRLLVDLVHRPRWLLGIGSDVVSFGFQALALAFGPIALVQPLAVTGLVFALPLAVRWRGSRLGPREWLATVAVTAGLAMFLAGAAPQAGVPETSGVRWLFIIVAVGGLGAVGIVAGQLLSGPVRASLYALAAGAAFGLLASLTKASTHLLEEGAVAFFTAWQPYSMAVVAVLGAIAQQSAFQAGPLPASLPVMDAVEPTVAVCIGVFAFGESLSTSVAALAVMALGILVLLAGIAVLDTSPVVFGLHERWEAAATGSDQEASRERSSAAKSGKRDATVSSGNSS